jgi:hypothetical protein
MSSSAVDSVNAEGSQGSAPASGKGELDLVTRMVKKQKEEGWSINDVH